MLDGKTKGGPVGVLVYSAWLAEAQLLDGKIAEAVALATENLQLVESTGQRTGQCISYRVLAMAAAKEDPPNWNSVDSILATCLSLAEKRGERPHVALTQFRYAELLQQKGDLPKAREQLIQATALFREMEMTWWLEQGEALGKELGTP